jgi:hypothetical protein
MLNSPEHPDPIPTISLYYLISSRQNLSAKIGLHYIFQAQKIPVTLWVKKLRGGDQMETRYYWDRVRASARV